MIVVTKYIGSRVVGKLYPCYRDVLNAQILVYACCDRFCEGKSDVCLSRFKIDPHVNLNLFKHFSPIEIFKRGANDSTNSTTTNR